MKVYFDNAATTMVCREAADAALRVMTENYGNPSSTHSMGREAKAILDTARKSVAAAVGADPREIFFTSGGTEADNWAVMGAAESCIAGESTLSSPAMSMTLSTAPARSWKPGAGRSPA